MEGILYHYNLIKSDYIKKLPNHTVTIEEKQESFTMTLELVFPKEGELYLLGKHNPDDSGMNTLLFDKFPDGVILWCRDNRVDVFVMELKKTATAYLERIPSQLHMGVLRALADIAILHSETDYQLNQVVRNDLEISYTFFIGTVNEKSLVAPKGLPSLKTTPGVPARDNDKLVAYHDGYVYYNCSNLGKRIRMSFEKLKFSRVGISENYFYQKIL